MALSFPADSVGLVEPKTAHITTPLTLACGRVLDEHQLVYETYGELNEEKSNAILICHALSGHHHAAGYYGKTDNEKPGWWENCIGPGKALDTNIFYIVVPNNIGGCHGSTGPSSINPSTNQVWGADFPPLRFRDWVNSQQMLADYLKIEKWLAVVGGSLGGMQVMRWAVEYPDRLSHAVILASAMKLTPQNIAFNELARRAIKSDPDFCDGHYLQQGKIPRHGLALARMIAHITYLSDDALEQRFGRDLKTGSFDQGQDSPIQFEIESYLNYKGDQFSTQFDANTYLLITRMLDVFDLAREYDNCPVKAFSKASCKFFVCSFSTDWRFKPECSRDIANALIQANKYVTYVNIDTDKGHDGFLLPIPRYIEAFNLYMAGVASSLTPAQQGAS